MMGAIFVSMKARTCFTTVNSSAVWVSMRSWNLLLDAGSGADFLSFIGIAIKESFPTFYVLLFAILR
jgi:hypothetical protein